MCAYIHLRLLWGVCVADKLFEVATDANTLYVNEIYIKLINDSPKKHAQQQQQDTQAAVAMPAAAPSADPPRIETINLCFFFVRKLHVLRMRRFYVCIQLDTYVET